MNNLIPFNYDGIHGVRVIQDEKDSYFVARDICDILELGDVSKAVSRLPEIMKGTNSVLTLGGMQEMLTVTEAGLYKLVFTSRKPEAEKFTDWVASDVIPSIRKHGMYAKDELLDNPDLLIEVATKLKEERHARLIAENKIKELTPAADLGNAMRNNDGLIIIRDFVKVLANVGIKIRQCDLFSWLVKKEYLYQNTRGDYKPRVEYVHSGLFKVAETPVETRTKGSFISYTTRLTAKGQEYFINKLKGEFPCQLQ